MNRTRQAEVRSTGIAGLQAQQECLQQVFCAKRRSPGTDDDAKTSIIKLPYAKQSGGMVRRKAVPVYCLRLSAVECIIEILVWCGSGAAPRLSRVA